MDLVRKAFPDVSSDFSVCANRGVPSTKSNKGTSHKVFMARLSHFALGENWDFSRPTHGAFLQGCALGAIRGALIDDCSLARLLKQHGGRLWLGLTDNSRSLRRYQTFAEVERMVSCTAFNPLNHSSLLLLGTVVGMVITYLLPPLLLYRSSKVALVLSDAAWAAMTITYSTMVRYYRLNPAWALYLRLEALFYLGATVHSALKYWSSSRGDWKGRVQDVHNRRTPV